MTQQIKPFQLNVDTELLLPGNPASALAATPKQYVDNEISILNTTLGNTLGQVSIVNSGPGYTVLSNGLFYYDIQINNSQGINVITLPIANNTGSLVQFQRSSFGVSFVSMTTTTITINNTSLSALILNFIAL